MRHHRILAIGLGTIVLLIAPHGAVWANSNVFSLAERVSDSSPSALNALYHGVAVYWPTGPLEFPLDEMVSGPGEKTWFWIEAHGRGRISVLGVETPDLVWVENPEISELVKTWEWRRFPIDANSVAAGRLTLNSSPWGDIFLGRAFFTRDPEVLPPSAPTLEMSEDTQLIQRRAVYPDADLSWGAAFIRLQNSKEETIETSVVDRQGNFSALVPRQEVLFATLLDRRGVPISERTEIASPEEGVTFHPLDGSERLLWIGDRELGLTLRAKDFEIRQEAADALLLLRVLDTTAVLSKFHRVVESESEHRNPTILDLIVEDSQLVDRKVDFVIADFLQRMPPILTKGHLRRILTAEGRTVAKAMTLASEHRDAIEGVVAWSGDPGEAVAGNFDDCPVALVGLREDLARMGDWIETCNSIQSPLLVNSFWSDPDPQTLAADIAEGVSWVCLPTLGGIDSKVEHAAYLSACGRHQWVWISEVSPPGALARVRAEWRSTGVIDVAVENVDRVRIHLNCGLENPGRQVTLSLDALTLPITLGPGFDALELRRRPDALWAPRFIRFDSPLEDRTVARIPSAGIEKGSELKAFARFVRDELSADCSWGYLMEHGIPGGPLSELALCNVTRPNPYARIDWTFNEIERFHRWRNEKGNLSLELAGYRPGVTETGEDSSHQKLRCAITESELLRFFEDEPDARGEFERLAVTQREMIGSFLSRQFAP